MQRLQKLTRAVLLAAAVFSTSAVLPDVFGPLSVTSAEAAVARRIEVRGNTRIEKETVLSYMTFSTGQSYGAADIDESLKALFATGLFADVRITPRGSTVVVTISENPIINRVSFEGNKKVKDDALKTAVRSQERSMLTRARVQSDVQNILEAYRRSGRYDATVDPKIIDRGNNRVDLVFEISEGKKTGVERITFIGNHAFSDRRLRDIIRTRESGFLSWLRSTDTYDPDRLSSDQELLREFYHKKGYADFYIVSATADLDRENNVFHVTFTVEEGEQYTISDVEVVSSLSAVDPNDLYSSVLTDAGDKYNSQRIERTIEDMTVKVAEKGYAFAQVRPRASRDYENKTISLTYYIEEGPRAYVERINIIGNDRTREYVIRREFDLAEGDAFNRTLLSKAERRLKALQFFDKVSITTARGSAPDRVVINVRVEEKATGEVSFGAGYSTADGVIGDISVSEKNFLGRGQYIKLGIGGGASSRSYEFTFREPFFLGRRIGFDFSAYRKTNDSNDYRAYDEEKTGGEIGFTLPLREDETTVRLYYRIYQTKLSDPNGLATSLANCPAASGLSRGICDALGTNLTSLAGYKFVYNTLDNRIDPKDGIYASFGQEVAGLGGDSYYVKTTAEASVFHEVLPEMGVVGMLRAKGGHITSFGGHRLRVIDQFMMGGDMVRGFANSGIGPRDITTDDAIGGQYFVATTAEANFGLPGIPQEFGLTGAVFADAGSVWGADSNMVNLIGAGNVVNNDFAIRASVGAGIRWKSPFGPISANVAYPLMKEKYDNTQIFRLSGGTRF